jgi:hypothetical protein
MLDSDDVVGELAQRVWPAGAVNKKEPTRSFLFCERRLPKHDAEQVFGR